VSGPINFGPLAAQDDPNLLDYFVQTEHVSKLISARGQVGGSQYIVVSRPGAGKSAIFQWLASRASTSNIVVARGANHRLLPTDNESFNADDYFTLAFGELALELVAQAHKRFGLPVTVKKQTMTFLSAKNLKSMLGAFARAFQGVTVLGFGVSLNPMERSQYIEKLRDRLFQERLEHLLRQIGDSVQCALVIDDPEHMITRGLSALSRENAIRLGALLSALAKIDGLGFKVQVFLREQYWQSVREHYDNASHFSDRVRPLGWTESELVDVIRRRARKLADLDWAGAFAVDEGAFITEVFPYLVNGPRDLISICNVAGTRGTPIDVSALRLAIKQAQSDVWSEVRRQFNEIYPEFDAFAKAAVGALYQRHRLRLTALSTAESVLVDEYIDTSGPIGKLRTRHEWIEDLALSSARRSLDLLFVAGCLGYRIGEERTYPWAGRSVERFAMADKYFICPAFEPQQTSRR
jgi:hypothetical protein